MIRKCLSYNVCQCLECNSLLIYKPASEGFPAVCSHCGIRWDVTLNQQQRMQMERMQQQRGPKDFNIKVG